MRLVLPLLPLLLATGCTPAEVPGPARNVLLISLDTTRADHLAGFGGTESETPTLARLVREGMRFTDVTAAAPTTLASHASLVTGSYPHTHGVARNGYVLDEANVTLAEQFRARGFRTAAVLGSFALEQRFGFGQGFERYDQSFDQLASRTVDQSQRRAERVTAAALAALDELEGERWFAFVHYFDPHAPYAPPEDFVPPGGPRESTPEDFERSARFHQERRFGTALGATAPIQQGFPAHWIGRTAEGEAEVDPALRGLYAGEVSYLDSALGALLAGLEQRGLLDETLVIVTADHGESFTEHHDLWNHGLWLYQTTVHVPLVLRFPDGRGAGQALDLPISSIDLAPTLHELFGLARPERCEGVSLVPLLAGRPLERGLVFSEATQPGVAFEEAGEWGNKKKPKAVRSGRHKLLWSPYTGTEELYDLAADPEERHDLLRTPDATVTALHAELTRELRRWSRSAAPLPSSFDRTLLDETLERLSELGYSEGAPEER